MKHDASAILVVDDEPDIVSTVIEFLDSLGYDCTGTTDPRQALSLMEGRSFDLILTDLKMGDLTGMDILAAADVRQASDTRVILMTAYPTIENAISALSSGAQDYILKPFSFDTLEQVVENALEKQRLARENITLRESLALYRASEALEAPLDLPDYLQMLLDVAILELGADVAQLGVMDRKEGVHSFQDQVARRASPDAALIPTDRLWDLATSMQPGEGPIIRTEEGGVGPLLALPLRAAGDLMGLLVLQRHPGSPAFTSAQARALSIIGSGAAVAIKNARLYNRLQEQYLRAIQAVVAAVEAKDPYTRGHSEMVSRYAAALGREVDLPAHEVEGLRIAGLLHDAGKIGVPEAILLKNGKLTDEEYETIKEHVVMSERIVEPLRLEPHVMAPISQHHERLDGTGYPRGLSEESITVGSRILAVADTYDALISDRVYRGKMSREEAFARLDEFAGSKLDRELVEVMKGLIAKIESGETHLSPVRQ